jgi:hypothetical protein
MEIIGRELQVGFATEAVRGTAESSVDRWLRNVTTNIIEKAEHVQDDTTRGVLEDMENRRVVKKYIEGDFEGIAQIDALGFLYASVYGKVSSSVVAGSVYDHVFGVKQNTIHQSLTVFTKDGSVQNLKLAGCVVNTLEVSGSVDDFVRVKANIIGQTATDGSASPSYNTEYDFIGKDITIKLADSEAGLSGATAIKVKDFTITHDQGIIRDHVFGSYTPGDLYNSKNSIEGEITINFSDETYKDLYLGDSAKYMQIVIQGTSDLGGGYYPTLTYVFNKVKITDWDRSGGNDELVTEKISFKAFYNETDSEASTVTLRNLTSSYANVPSN